MIVKIKCPKCGTEGSLSLVESNYQGPYRCWKCRELFTIKMENNELKNLKNFIELKLRECFSHYERDFIKWSADSFADLIARELHREYHIKQKWDENKYLLIPEMEHHPLCHGCENEFGTCGTPCTMCSIADKIQKEWKIVLVIPGKFRICEKVS